MKNYYPAEIAKILNSIVILIDTREKKIDHITQYFDRHNIRYEFKKLDYGDFSFYVPECPVLNIMENIYFDKKVVVERKSGLDELVANISIKNGARIENEFIRSKGARLTLMVENDSLFKIIAGEYKTNYKPVDFLKWIKHIKNRYGISTEFVSPVQSGIDIYFEMREFLRERLERGIL